MPEYGFTVSVQNLASLKMKEIEESLAKMGVKAKVETHEVAKDFEFMGERMGETFKNLKSLLLTGLGITALFEGWEFIEKSKEAFEGLEKAVVRVDTVLKSTKFAAGFSSEDIQDQAKELSKGIVNKRDEILDAQGMLLSFHDIKGAKFTETMKSVADFATFYKENMTEAAMQVGKAINDPLKGMTRLQRMGVEFSDEQKKQIKNYVQQGELVKAQEVILRELRTEFGGQAQAFALTDEGKIQVAAKQWEELQFKIGEIVSRVEVSLIPAFTKIVNVIKYAFNSSVIQFFIEHIKDLVSWTLKLLPIWVAYKAIMIGVSVILPILEFDFAGLAETIAGATLGLAGATASMEAFAASIASTGIGALAVGIGLVVEKLIDMNAQLNEAIDKKYRLTESNDDFRNSKDKFENIKERMDVFKNLDPSAKSQLLADVKDYLKSTSEKLPILSHRGGQLLKGAQVKHDPTGWDKVIGLAGQGGIDFSAFASDSLKTGFKTVEELGKFGDNFKEMNTNLAQAKLFMQILAGNKIKGIDYKSAGEGVKGDATNISNLSGASGGLGQAKIVNIHINTLQQNNGVHESKSKADQTIEMLTEMINGFSDSQNSQ